VPTENVLWGKAMYVEELLRCQQRGNQIGVGGAKVSEMEP